jgi:hypothetical protein
MPQSAFVAAILVGVFGIVFRSFALRAYASLPTGFDGAIVFRQRYLIEQGRFLLDQLPTYSYWSGGVNTELGFYLMELIAACILQISYWATLPASLLHQLILTTALIALALILLLRNRSSQIAAPQALIVAGLATLGTPVVINYLTGANVAYGWLLLFIVTIIVTSDLQPIWRLPLTLALTAIGPPLYHTFGFLLAAFVVLLWFFGRLVGLRRIVASPLSVLVCYFSYQIYVSVQFFGELATGLADVFTLEFLRRDRAIPDIAGATAGPINLRYFHLALFIILAIPIAVAMYRYSRIVFKRIEGSPINHDSREICYLTVTAAMSVAVVFFALMFGMKVGLSFLINRGAMFMSVPAVLAVITELRHRYRYHRYVYPLAIVVIAMSLFSFWVQSSTVYVSNYYTKVEAEGYAWLKPRLKESDVIFTEFRLSGPFIADGHFRVIGVTGRKGEDTLQLLNDIYYKSTPESITPAIDQVRTNRESRAADYLFLSALMMNEFPGINGYGRIFPAAPLSFFQALDASPEWELVFKNSEISIFQRKSSLQAVGPQP